MNRTKIVYFYHPDHIGSANWITNSAGEPIQHLQYLPFGELRLDQRLISWHSRYSFSAKEKDEESGYSYFGARYYDSDLSIFISSDPLSSLRPDIQSYHYCSQNPLNRTDMTGMSDDWVKRTVNGIEEIYYDRDVKSQAEVDKKYGANSGVTHLSDGSKVAGGRYTVYNDHVNNRDGVVKDANGNVVSNHRTIIYGDKFTLFAGVTNSSVNAATLHQNYFGTSYTGPDNPRDYDKVENFDYRPRNISEYLSIEHDLTYKTLGADGVRDALLNTNTWQADANFALANINAMIYCGAPLKDQARSLGAAVAFGTIATYKAVGQGVKNVGINIKKILGL